MDYGDSVLYNDEVLFEQARASRKAAWNWRFRNVGRRGALDSAAIQTWRITVQAARAAAKTAGVAVRRRIDRAQAWPSRRLFEHG